MCIFLVTHIIALALVLLGAYYMRGAGAGWIVLIVFIVLSPLPFYMAACAEGVDVWRARFLLALFCAQLVALALAVLGAYVNTGCGACENDAACDGLFGECICTGNHLGEYCEESCGEFGQVDDGACECSGNYTGAFCNLRPGEIVEEELVSRSVLTACSVVAVVGCCIVGGGWVADNPHRGGPGCPGLAFFFMFAPAGCGAICVAMTVLAVVAFGGWAGLGMGAGLALVLAGLAVGNFFVGDYFGTFNGKGGKGMIMAW